MDEAPRGKPRAPGRLIQFLLAACWSLFLFRVSAQLLQRAHPVSFLPPFEAWHSGVLAYRHLLVSQALILAALLRIVIAHWRGRVPPLREKGRRILILGCIYAGIMFVRYGLRMARFPAERWTGGALPIFFHLILAAFVIGVGLHHFRNGSKAVAAAGGARTWAWRAAYALIGAGIGAWLAYQLHPAAVARKLGLNWSGRHLELPIVPAPPDSPDSPE